MISPLMKIKTVSHDVQRVHDRVEDGLGDAEPDRGARRA
jgi:hypothetical protein